MRKNMITPWILGLLAGCLPGERKNATTTPASDAKAPAPATAARPETNPGAASPSSDAHALVRLPQPLAESAAPKLAPPPETHEDEDPEFDAMCRVPPQWRKRERPRVTVSRSPSPAPDAKVQE